MAQPKGFEVEINLTFEEQENYCEVSGRYYMRDQMVVEDKFRENYIATLRPRVYILNIMGKL